MIRLRLVQPGHPDIEHKVESDSIVLGRDADCDVVVAEPFVSKNHVQLLRGLVIVDLRSRNGTFVDGEKLARARLLTGGTFNIAGRLDVMVEAEEPARSRRSSGPRTLSSVDLGSDVDPVKVLREELESERARAAVLTRDLAQARQREQELAAQDSSATEARDQQVEDLRRRLASLKEQLEGREVEASASLQARLADEERKAVQEENRKLRERVRQLESAVGGGGPDPAQAAELQRLRDELARAREKALPPGEFFAQLNRENAELRERLARFESGGASPAMPASELFFQLQAENADLRRRLAGGEAGPAASWAQVGTGTDSAEEVARLRAALARAETELGRARRSPTPASAASVPARPALAVAPEGSVLALARLVVDRDVEKVEPSDVTSVEAFFVLESLRFLRGAERVVTRLAGEMIQLYHLHTMLPNTEGNFRSLTRRFLDDPQDEAVRDELAAYLAKLSRWLVVAVGAPRKAALEFIRQLKEELSEESLIGDRPIPALKKVSGQTEAELWKRACEHLAELSTELIEDRLEKLERHTARVLLGGEEGV